MVCFVFCIYDKYNNVVRPTVYRVTLDKKKGMEQTIYVYGLGLVCILWCYLLEKPENEKGHEVKAVVKYRG